MAGLLSRLTESLLCDWRGTNAITPITCCYQGQVQPFVQHSVLLSLLSSCCLMKAICHVSCGDRFPLRYLTTCLAKPLLIEITHWLISFCSLIMEEISVRVFHAARFYCGFCSSHSFSICLYSFSSSECLIFSQ